MSTANVPVLQAGPDPIDVTDATFQTEVLDRSLQTPVVVDLWAPWCGPCRQLGPILEKVVGATDGQVVLAKVNVDDNPQISQTFRVQGIPAVYAVAGGKVVDGFVGAQGEAAVAEFVVPAGPHRGADGAGPARRGRRRGVAAQGARDRARPPRRHDRPRRPPGRRGRPRGRAAAARHDPRHDRDPPRSRHGPARAPTSSTTSRRELDALLERVK